MIVGRSRPAEGYTGDLEQGLARYAEKFGEQPIDLIEAERYRRRTAVRLVPDFARWTAPDGQDGGRRTEDGGLKTGGNSQDMGNKFGSGHGWRSGYFGGGAVVNVTTALRILSLYRWRVQLLAPLASPTQSTTSTSYFESGVLDISSISS